MISRYQVMDERGGDYPTLIGERGGRIPVIDPPPAGATAAESYNEGEHAYVDRCGVEHELAFAVVITGDSMEPRLSAGDTVIFVPALEEMGVQPCDNDIVFVRFTPGFRYDGHMVATFIFLGQDQYLLLKENRAYPPRHIKRKDIAQLAVAVQRRSDRF